MVTNFRLHIVFFFTLGIILTSYSTYAQLSAKFIYTTPGDSCESRSVNFDASTSTGNIQEYNWVFRNSNGDNIGSGSGKQVFRNFLTPDEYSVELTVKGNGGQAETAVAKVNVYKNPEVNFEVSSVSGCSPLEVIFTDLSENEAGKIIRWKWNYDDGVSEVFNTEQKPTHTYTKGGDYDPSLIVTNNVGCTGSVVKENLIDVYESVVPDFNISERISCSIPHEIKIQNTSEKRNRFNFEWDLGDGTVFQNNEASFQYNYTEKGDFKIKLKATNLTGDCSYESELNEATTVIIGSPEVDFNIPASICVGDTLPLYASTNNTRNKVFWFFEDNNTEVSGINIIHNYDTSGIWDIRLVARDTVIGCISDTLIKSILVRPYPKADFDIDSVLACSPPHLVTLENKSTNAQRFEIDFGDGTPVVQTSNFDSIQHTYRVYGRFTITLNAYNDEGCVSEKEFKYIRIEEPYIDFKIFPPKVCQNTSFSVISTALKSYIIESYNYAFSDGTEISTTAEEISHSFSDLGNQSVQVTALTDKGCYVSSDLLEVEVMEVCYSTGNDDYNQNERLSFIRQASCDDKYTYNFTALSMREAIAVWTMNGDTIETKDSTLQYTFPKNDQKKEYIVNLTLLKATTRDTLSSKSIGVVIVDEAANFEIKDIETCRNTPVMFTPIGINTEVISRFVWDFGDSSDVKIIKNPNGNKNGKTNYTYTKNGFYDPSLIIEDVFGCKDSVTITNLKVRGPHATFLLDSNHYCSETFNSTFKDLSYASEASIITERIWDFDDKKSEFITLDTLFDYQFEHQESSRAFNLKLTVKDNNGCSDFYRDTIMSFSPKAQLPVGGIFKCGDLNITIDNKTEALITKNNQYTWYYGDGTFSNGKKGKHTYPDTGSYDIALKVIDDGGCIDSVYETAYVQLVKPKANFIIGGDTVKCVGTYALNFESKSEYATNYKWDFGDGTISETNNSDVSHFYELGGKYQISLTTYGDGKKCTDSISKTVSIRGPYGTLNIGDNYLCASDTMNAFFEGANVSKFFWDFGDLTNTEALVNQDSVTHFYNRSGKYVPSLILISPDNCQATLEYKDTVYVDRINAGTDAIIKCGGKNVALTGNSALNIEGNYYWKGPNGASFSPSTKVINPLVDSAGYYFFSYKDSLCTDYDSVMVTSLGPIPNVEAGPSKKLDCITSDIQLEGSSTSSPVSFSWSGSGFTSSESSVFSKPMVNKVGYYYLQVKRGECFNVDSVRVLPCSLNPQDTSISICANQEGLPLLKTEFDLTALKNAVAGDEISSVEWYLDSAFTSKINRPDSVTVKNGELFYAKITSTDNSEIARGSLHVTVYKSSIAEIKFSSDTICESDGPIYIEAEEVRHNFNYTWYFNGEKITSNSQSQNLILESPEASGTYVLQVGNAFCEARLDTLPIRIYEQPEVFFSENILNVIYNKEALIELPLIINLEYDDSITFFKWTNTEYLRGLEKDSIDNMNYYQLVKPVYYNVQDEEVSNTYKVDVLTGKGNKVCEAKATITINNFVPVKVPNVFTPNNDGVNDTWEIFGLARYPDSHVQVFSRWGKMLFESYGYSEPWDGYYHGSKVPFGTYYYVIDFKGDTNYSEYNATGWLLISE